MFRRVDLPARVPGRLLLHSMPGQYLETNRSSRSNRSTAALRSKRLNAKIEMGSFHVSGILETSKCMLITSLLAEGNEKIKQETAKSVRKVGLAS